MKALIPWFLACSLAAVETPPELKPLLAKQDAAIASAEKAFHQAQAQAKEDTLKEFEKLLKAEQKKKKYSTLAADLELRIPVLTKEIALLRDEALLKATELNEKLIKNELTEEQWSAIPAAVLEIDALEARNPVGIRINAGDLYFIAPHPNDTWKGGGGPEAYNWKGKADGWMKLIIRCGEKVNEGLFVTETGSLTIGPSDDRCEDNVGQIRVKIMRLK
jgi:hypothetical protein